MRGGEITALPWRGNRNKFMVYVPPLPMPDGGRTGKDRKVVVAQTKGEALRWGQQRRAALVAEYQARLAGRLDAIAEAKKLRAPTLAAFWPDYLRHLRTRPRTKPAAVDAIFSMMTIHILPLAGHLPLDRITNEVKAKLQTQWTEGGYEYVSASGKLRRTRPTRDEKTHGNRLTVLRSCLRTALEWGKIQAMPCKIEVRLVRPKEAAHYTHERYEELVEAARAVGKQEYAAVLLEGDAGLRRGEVIGLRCEDIDFKHGHLRVGHNIYWKGSKWQDLVPKGGTEEIVPCPPRLLSALRDVAHLRGGTLFQDEKGEPLTPPQLRLWILKAERRAGWANCNGRSHILRHTYCSRLAEAGVPAMTIKALARHKDLSTTQRYMHLSPGRMEQGLEMLEAYRMSGGRPAVASRLQDPGLPTASGVPSRT